MALNHALLPEFDQEMAYTRRSLERVPDGKFGWKPHEKSMTMGQLVLHIATIPGWVNATLDQDSLDIAPPGGPAWEPPKANSTKEILEIFDKGVAAARVHSPRRATTASRSPGRSSPAERRSSRCPASLSCAASS